MDDAGTLRNLSQSERVRIKALAGIIQVDMHFEATQSRDASNYWFAARCCLVI